MACCRFDRGEQEDVSTETIGKFKIGFGVTGNGEHFVGSDGALGEVAELITAQMQAVRFSLCKESDCCGQEKWCLETAADYLRETDHLAVLGIGHPFASELDYLGPRIERSLEFSLEISMVGKFASDHVMW